MYQMNDLKIGTVIAYEGAPYVVQYTQHVQMGRGSAVLRTKLKNLITGQVLERTFKGGDRIEEADLSRSGAQLTHREGDNYFFMDNESFEQFSLPKDQVGEISNFVGEGSNVEILNFEGKPVSLSLPTKVELKVTEAPEGIRGDTAQGKVTKPVTVETGYVVNAPLFVKKGDVIRVNTETGEYVERV